MKLAATILVTSRTLKEQKYRRERETTQIQLLHLASRQINLNSAQKLKNEKRKMGNRKTQRSFNPINPSVIVRNSILLLLLLLSPTILAKSRRPITETETRQRKNSCYADIESGMWGQQCKSSTIAKENCALRCLSPACYEIIYESDPLEEGEKDLVRGQEFKYCMHKLSLGESLQDIKGSFGY